MEFRYVYRRIEDVLGFNKPVIPSAHSDMTLDLRMAYREQQDIARQAELKALCLSSLSAHPEIDVHKANTKINDSIKTVFDQRFPYVKDDPSKPKESQYAEIFKFLEQLKKDKESKKEKEGDKNAQGVDVQLPSALQTDSKKEKSLK